MTSLGIFGSWRTPEQDQDYKLAYSIAKISVRNGMRVLNGGYTGIMEAASRGANDNSGIAIGYTWKGLDKLLSPNSYLSKNKSFNTNVARIGALIDDADICVFFPGRTGSIAELALAVEKRAKGEMKYPLYLAGDYWLDFFKFRSQSNAKLSYESDKPGGPEIYKVINTPEEYEQSIKDLS